MYTDIVVSCAHEVIDIDDIRGNICCWYANGYSTVSKVAVLIFFFFFFFFASICSNEGLHVYYSNSVLGYTCVMW